MCISRHKHQVAATTLLKVAAGTACQYAKGWVDRLWTKAQTDNACRSRSAGPASKVEAQHRVSICRLRHRVQLAPASNQMTLCSRARASFTWSNTADNAAPNVDLLGAHQNGTVLYTLSELPPRRRREQSYCIKLLPPRPTTKTNTVPSLLLPKKPPTVAGSKYCTRSKEGPVNMINATRLSASTI